MPLLQAITRISRTFHERRRSLREAVQFPAWIDCGDGPKLLPCTVLDVSDSGARIMVASAARLPKEFWLVLTSDGTRRRQCRIAWRSDAQIGVRYLSPVRFDSYLVPLN